MLNISGLHSGGTGPRVREGQVCRSAGGWRGQRVWAGLACDGLSVPPCADQLCGGLTRPPAENRVLHLHLVDDCRVVGLCGWLVSVPLRWIGS
jgi:hypothetical protein